MFNEILYNDALFNDISISTLYVSYSRGAYDLLPNNTVDLTTLYNLTDYADVAAIDGIYVDQTGTFQFLLHQFKDVVQVANTCDVTWVGTTNFPPNTNPPWTVITLQIFNRNSSTWELIASNGTSPAYTQITLTAHMSDLTNYRDANGVICCRVYQLALG